jgi:hypothetical protein
MDTYTPESRRQFNVDEYYRMGKSVSSRCVGSNSSTATS